MFNHADYALETIRYNAFNEDGTDIYRFRCYINGQHILVLTGFSTKSIAMSAGRKWLKRFYHKQPSWRGAA